MLSYLLVILIIVFLILNFYTTNNYEGFAHGSSSHSSGLSSHSSGLSSHNTGNSNNRISRGTSHVISRGMSQGSITNPVSRSDANNNKLENVINNNLQNSLKSQNQTSNQLINILNNQPNQMQNQMQNQSQNQMQNQSQNQMQNQSQNQSQNQMQNQMQNMSSVENIKKMRFQTPTRLEMEMPYEEKINQIAENTNNSILNSFEDKLYIKNNLDTNTKIKTIIKKSAELSFLALDNNEDPISALKSSNYAIAYISALQEIYGEDEIKNATKINVIEFKKELLKIQNRIILNIKNTCSTFETDKQYLLKIINDM